MSDCGLRNAQEAVFQGGRTIIAGSPAPAGLSHYHIVPNLPPPSKIVTPPPSSPPPGGHGVSLWPGGSWKPSRLACGVCPAGDVVTYTALIATCSAGGLWQRGLQLFEEMHAGLNGNPGNLMGGEVAELRLRAKRKTPHPPLTPPSPPSWVKWREPQSFGGTR